MLVLEENTHEKPRYLCLCWKRTLTRSHVIYACVGREHSREATLSMLVLEENTHEKPRYLCLCWKRTLTRSHVIYACVGREHSREATLSMLVLEENTHEKPRLRTRHRTRTKPSHNSIQHIFCCCCFFFCIFVFVS